MTGQRVRRDLELSFERQAKRLPLSASPLVCFLSIKVKVTFGNHIGCWCAGRLGVDHSDHGEQNSSAKTFTHLMSLITISLMCIGRCLSLHRGAAFSLICIQIASLFFPWRLTISFSLPCFAGVENPNESRLQSQSQQRDIGRRSLAGKLYIPGCLKYAS